VLLDYEKIKLKTLEVFKKCEIQSFPIDCFYILDTYNISYQKYSSQSKEKEEQCLMISDDAFTLKGRIFYNANRIPGRIRFSLMHELGHILLNHQQAYHEEQEQEANFFATHILAPRIAIQQLECKNFVDTSITFDITNESATYAFDDFRRWQRMRHYYKDGLYEREFRSHFYNINQKFPSIANVIFAKK
jgi:Zn-dependent peptidase ImmA (M78 family)